MSDFKTYRVRARLSRTLHKRVTTVDGSRITRTTVADGSESGEIGIEIDVDALFHFLGHRALSNRLRKAKALGGIIKAQAYDVRRDPS